MEPLISCPGFCILLAEAGAFFVYRKDIVYEIL